MTRYFIGLMLPLSVQTHLTSVAATIQASLPAEHPYRVSWTHPADLHCTLLFIGNYDDEHHLITSMTDVAADLPPADLTVSGATHWLGRNSLAVPVAGADAIGTTFIDRMGNLSSDRFAGRRRFHGHVTIGRVRPVPAQPDDVLSHRSVAPITWQASQVHLLRGAGGGPGSRYRVIAQAPLAATPQ